MASSSNSDEGEIRDVGVEKATTTPPSFDGNSVDRHNRNHFSNSTSMSPEQNHRSRDRRSTERSRSPYSDRAPRGTKRGRDDDYPDRSRDPRRFKVHYEDNNSSAYTRRPRVSYEDIDRGTPVSAGLSYDDRDRYSEKRSRTRSRSPYRANREDDYSRDGQNRRAAERYNSSRARGSRYFDDHRNGDMRNRDYKDQSVSKRGENPLPAGNTRQEAKIAQGHSLQSSDKAAQQQEKSKYSFSSSLQDKTLTQERKSVAFSLSNSAAEPAPEEEPLDEATLIEQRRKRREAIKAKYRSSATPLLVQALQIGDKTGDSTPAREDEDSPSAPASPAAVSTPSTPMEFQDGAASSAFAINDDLELANSNRNGSVGPEEDGPSAADYDPTADMREDNQRDVNRHNDEVSASTYDETKPADERNVLLPIGPASVEETAAGREPDELDMFADDDDNDDMFAEEPIASKKFATKTTEDTAKAATVPRAKALDIGMLDDWDDIEGYYKIILGELLNGRYHVQANLGKGMFSGVVRATDVTTKKLVAIKLIRNNETMRKAGMKEIEILQKINNADPEDKKHMIRLERHFEHKGHLCMVFENLSINLREVLKKFGRDVGINLRAVRAYAQQMFLGLSLMRKCNVLHADLKPDNILVNESRNMLKICDLGSASDASDNEITPYLVSRFYRAPEIILGMQYDFAIDVWSIGCTLYELYTGKILFTGRTNNQMLRSIMECRGKFTTKILKRAQFAHMHFDEMANFRSVEQDKLTGKDTVKTLAFTKPTRDLRTRLSSASKGLTESESRELTLFADLLDRCLALNPEKRITPTEALRHPFILKTLR